MGLSTTDATDPDWRQLHIRVGRAFRPNTPVDVRDVFAGREAQITRVLDVILQPGQHAIVFGERGVGKTSLANVLSAFLVLTEDENEADLGPIVSPRVNCDGDDTLDSVWRKVFAKIKISQESQSVGFSAQQTTSRFWATDLLPNNPLTPDEVRRLLTDLGRGSLPLLIVDEFDRLSEVPRRAFADLIKMLSDHAVPATVVLVGVADSIDGLLQDHESVSRALVQVHMPRMTPNEIHQILVAGARTLGMVFGEDAAQRITRISQGLPHYAHLLGLHSARTAILYKSLLITISHVHAAIQRALADAQHSVQRAYHEAVRSAHKDALFADVLLACALAECDELGYFKAQDVRQPLCMITGKRYDIPSFAQHLRDFSAQKRGRILQVVGEQRRFSYRFRDPLIQPFVIMYGAQSGRLPEAFFSELDN